MKLKEWTLLVEEQQNELIAQWYQEGLSHKYMDLAEDAVSALKNELKSFKGITNIRIGGGASIRSGNSPCEIRQLVLNVCTLFATGHAFEGLPVAFAGFRVEQLNLGDKRDSFLKTFVFLMKKLKGWGEADVLAWAENRIPEPLNDSLSGGFLFVPVYDQGPVLLACSALIDGPVMESLKKVCHDPIQLRNGMVVIICDALKKVGSSEYYHPDREHRLNWEPIANGIRALIDRSSVRAN